MMRLSDFFSPIKNINQILRESKSGFWGHEIAFDISAENLEKSQVVIFSVAETRNSSQGKRDLSFDTVRNAFYKLSVTSKIKVADFGELKIGNTIDDTYASLRIALQLITDYNVIPLILLGSQELSVVIAEVIQSRNNKKIETVFVDAKVDLDDSADFHSQTYLNASIWSEEKNIQKSLVAYQSYFVADQQLDQLKNLGFNLYRLGEIRNNFKEIEPILRDADFVSFDLCSIRQSDCSATNFTSPNGLYAEEACQIVNLAGLSDRVSCFAFSEFNSLVNDDNKSSHLIAQLMWYFILGLSNRKNDYPVASLEQYKKIFVKIDKLDFDLVFYSNEQNRRFWVEFPDTKGVDKIIISCSEKDYKKITNNEIPYRIWKRISLTM